MRIYSEENTIAITPEVHREISRFYSSKHEMTGGMVARDYLIGKSFEEQYEFGLKVLEMCRKAVG